MSTKRRAAIACTEAERTVLELFLRELRHAAAIDQQLHVTVDPYIGGGGAHIHFAYNLAGSSEEVSGRIELVKRPTHAASTGRRDLKRRFR